MTRQEIADTIDFCLKHGTMGGNDCFGLYTAHGNEIVKEGDYRSKCPNGRCETGCVVTAISESLAFLRETPYLMTLHELLTTSGAGWEESRFTGEEGEADEIILEPCAWCNGHLILENGTTANLHDEQVTETYNKAGGGYRIWRGDKPTEEQRKGEKWYGLSGKDASRAGMLFQIYRGRMPALSL